MNVRVPEPPLNEQDVGSDTGPPEIVQLVSLESKLESVAVTNVPGIPLEGSKLTDGDA